MKQNEGGWHIIWLNWDIWWIRPHHVWTLVGWHQSSNSYHQPKLQKGTNEEIWWCGKANIAQDRWGHWCNLQINTSVFTSTNMDRHTTFQQASELIMEITHQQSRSSSHHWIWIWEGWWQRSTQKSDTSQEHYRKHLPLQRKCQPRCWRLKHLNIQRATGYHQV